MTEALSLALRFLSDWHVGEGAGARGHIDAIVRRHPEDGLPYVPAKTLTGLLRDGCERVVYGLDGGDPTGPWHLMLREVFGSNQEDNIDRAARNACLSVGAARLPDSLRRAVLDTEGMSEALVFIKPGVKLDEHGVAQSQMLRFEEVVLAGAELDAPVSLEGITGERRDAAIGLLAAGARAVERMGARRRRGSGRCTLRLQCGSTEAPFVDTLRQQPPIGQRPDPEWRLALAAEPAARLGTEQWRVLALDLDLDSPVIVPSEVLGNMVTTLDHIPGSLLVPALDGWLRRLLGNQTTSALASGAIQVRNGYPSAGGLRLLPVPASLFKLKDGEDTINQLRGEAGDKRQRKQLRGGYVAPDALPDISARAEQVDRIAMTHATIEDASQRPTSAVGGVFTYQAIRPGQRLVAEIWINNSLCPDEATFCRWREGAPKTMRIGRSKKDDYGRVSMNCRSSVALVPQSADTLTVWLTSPLLLRTSALAPVLDAHGLARQLEVELGLPEMGLVPSDTPHSIYLRPWRDDGWNNAWQMRRATRFGLAPGSCASFKVNQTASADTLGRVQASGLGERRGEGYGELVFNPPLLAGLDVPIRKLEPDRRGMQQISEPPVTEFSKALQRRASRLVIRRKALEQSSEFTRALGWKSGLSPLPPNTQLGALRALLESAHDQAGLDRIGSWLTAVLGNEKRWSKWPDTTMRVLATHLDTDCPSSVWESLDLPSGPTSLPGHSRAELSAELQVEAVKILWLTAISSQLNINNRGQDNRKTTKGIGHGA